MSELSLVIMARSVRLLVDEIGDLYGVTQIDLGRWSGTTMTNILSR